MPRGRALSLRRPRTGGGADAREALNGIVDRTGRILKLIEGFMPESRWLDDAETLTYLHSCASVRRQNVRVPEIPMYLDALLADQPLSPAGSGRGSERRICAS